MKKIIIFTGEKNNAGDFLIKEKAANLFRYFLPDSELFFVNRTKSFKKDLDLINSCDFGVVAGGPAISNKCAEFLHFADVLDDIKIPIVFFGVGQFNKEIEFNNFKLRFSEVSKRLLERVEKSNYFSTTRDFKSLHYLSLAGYNNFKFSGCPVLYDTEFLEMNYSPLSLEKVNKVVFSCGSPFSKDKDFYKQQLNLINSLKNYFKDKRGNNLKFIVAMHHSADQNTFTMDYNNKKLYFDFINKLKLLDVEIIDISKNSKDMIDLYHSCDLHIGFRVHAHIFMTSQKKHSILLLEDGRGAGISEVINGRYFSAYKIFYLSRLLKIKLKIYDKKIHKKVIDYIQYADETGIYTNFYCKSYFNAMRDFFEQFTN